MEEINNTEGIEVHVGAEVSQQVFSNQHQLTSTGFNEGFDHNFLVVFDRLMVTKFAEGLVINFRVLDVRFGWCAIGEQPIDIMPSFS